MAALKKSSIRHAAPDFLALRFYWVRVGVPDRQISKYKRRFDIPSDLLALQEQLPDPPQLAVDLDR